MSIRLVTPHPWTSAFWFARRADQLARAGRYDLAAFMDAHTARALKRARSPR